MKKIVASILVLALPICFLQAQNDTMYIMKQGIVISKHKVKEVDSVIFYNPITTQQVGTVTDKDNNVYNTVTIGTQTWMKENLKVTQYNDGTTIPLVTDNAAWAALSTPAYCWYDNDAVTNKATYGALYNCYTVNTGKLCPTGWHIPSNAEWTTLTDYLGGESVAGGKMKEAGTTHWFSPNTGADNSSGFTALPAGGRDSNDGSFDYLGNGASFWSSTVDYSSFAWARYLSCNYAGVGRGSNYKDYGWSARCLQDN